MKQVKIIRTTTGEQTTGTLIIDGEPICLTLERPWRNNDRNVSCIPVGRYICRKYKSKRFGETYIVKHVPYRSYILFHKGNVVRHSKGCIILGSKYGKLNGETAVLGSGRAMYRFMEIMQNESSFELEIEGRQYVVK